MQQRTRSGFWKRITSRYAREVAGAALLASLLTVVVAHLPQMDLLQSGINDDNFTDLVLQTRGELPIDTAIRVLTYDASILDTFDMVDRQSLALQLAALFELKPRVVGVDFLIETARPEAPDGDAMLAALIADHPNLIFGIFHEDSLDRFRTPPPIFKIPESQLGCINLRPDQDNTMRTFSPLWGADGKKQFESFDVKIARAVAPDAAAYLRSFGDGDFLIDYAAGIGETRRNGAGGDQIFPVLPLKAIFDAVSSGDTARIAAFRAQLESKAVLVGYGDLRQGQVTSVVDRFYTPFKPEKNTLPDMHGVAIHANIVNTILQRRILDEMPVWANILWSSLLVSVLLAGRERLKRIKHPTRRAILTYTGFAALFLLAALIPVVAFRYTPYKFSMFMPIAALLIAVPTLEGMRKAIDLLLDVRRRIRLRSGFPESIRGGMLGILKPWSASERIEQATHFLEREFHTAAAVLFSEAAGNHYPKVPAATHAAPTLARMIAVVNAAEATGAAISDRARRAALLLKAMAADAVLTRTLRLSRSLYIAVNEIRRQSQLDADETAITGETSGAEVSENVAGYADLALKTLAGKGDGDDDERFDEIYRALERYARAAAQIMRGAAGTMTALINTAELPPYLFTCRCKLHGIDEPFLYFGEQEDANNRDDFFDLVFAGRTIRCQPVEHPGLTRFREMSAEAVDGRSG